ncbi:glycosyltransferase [Novosphingobium sp.]|uniref:glycosyltransferase n=1 Tax=Novosphingobium sp. TaxID=1874826 RepID=UPI003B51E14F
MKILDVILSLNPLAGGPQHTVRAMSQIWRSMGHQVDILTLDAPDAPYLEPGLVKHAFGRLGSPIRRPGLSAAFDRYGYAPGAARKMAEIVQDYDMVLVHGLWNYSTLLARRVMVGSGVPYCVFPHGMLDPWHREKYPLKDIVKRIEWPFIEGALLGGASGGLFTTQAEIDLADGSYLPYRIHPVLVGYGCQGPVQDAQVSLAALHDSFPALRGRKFLLFLSRIHPKKGCDTLLRAFAQCLPDLGDVDLVMAGPDQVGWSKELKDLAATLGIANRVHWVGMITGEVKWGAYHAADAFVLPSHGENFGIVVAEAMACGTPVIISDRVNLCDTVIEHKAGLVGPHDLASTVSLLRQFARMSPGERAAMSHAATDCYHTHYELDAAARRVVDILADIAKTAKAPGPHHPVAA